MLMLYKSI